MVLKEKEKTITTLPSVEERYFQSIQTVQSFKAQFGRAPRVLHVGNIANNAYLNAKLLNQIGYDCDVLCYDYYHIMACPEWEDVDFKGVIKDQLFPDWYSVNLKGYKRPKWFAQGPSQLSIEYLLAKRSKPPIVAWLYWQKLEFKRFVLCSNLINSCKKFKDNPGQFQDDYPLLFKLWKFYQSLPIQSLINRIPRVKSPVLQKLREKISKKWTMLTKKRSVFGKLAKFVQNVFNTVTPSLYRIFQLPGKIFQLPGKIFQLPGKIFQLTAKLLQPALICSAPETNLADLIAEFTNRFPDRQDCLTEEEVVSFLPLLPYWYTLFSYYDIIQGYSTDPIYPMLCGNKPYIAYEHGTIRDLPFEDSTMGRLTALAYAKADAIILTNADNLVKAQRLQPNDQKLVCGLHGFDDRKITNALQKLYSQPRATGRFGFGEDIKIFVAPARHHHAVKGNLNIIEAVHLIHQNYPGRFIVVFANWGPEAPLSRKIIAELGISDYFHWVEPLGKMDLYNAYRCVDSVMDQFVIPCTGSLSIDTMLIGEAPVIAYLDDEMLAEFYGETMPVFNAHSPMEIAEAMETVITNPEACKNKTSDAKAWMDNYHTYKSVIIKLTEAYRLTGVLS